MAFTRAPGDLGVVQSFVNTRDIEGGQEELSEPADLRAWLAQHELIAPSARVTATEHRHALELREALREVLLQNAGVEVDPDAAGVLDGAARRARLGLRFDEHGHVRAEPEAGGVPGALGRLLAIVAAAQDDGTWSRLKACLADNCRWAYYDRSRNHSAVWCDMRICGNRRKVRSYRERHHAPAE